MARRDLRPRRGGVALSEGPLRAGAEPFPADHYAFYRVLRNPPSEYCAILRRSIAQSSVGGLRSVKDEEYRQRELATDSSNWAKHSVMIGQRNPPRTRPHGGLRGGLRGGLTEDCAEYCDRCRSEPVVNDRDSRSVPIGDPHRGRRRTGGDSGAWVALRAQPTYLRWWLYLGATRPLVVGGGWWARRATCPRAFQPRVPQWWRVAQRTHAVGVAARIGGGGRKRWRWAQALAVAARRATCPRGGGPGGWRTRWRWRWRCVAQHAHAVAARVAQRAHAVGMAARVGGGGRRRWRCVGGGGAPRNAPTRWRPGWLRVVGGGASRNTHTRWRPGWWSRTCWRWQRGACVWVCRSTC